MWRVSLCRNSAFLLSSSSAEALRFPCSSTWKKFYADGVKAYLPLVEVVQLLALLLFLDLLAPLLLLELLLLEEPLLLVELLAPLLVFLLDHLDLLAHILLLLLFPLPLGLALGLLLERMGVDSRTVVPGVRIRIDLPPIDGASRRCWLLLLLRLGLLLQLLAGLLLRLHWLLLARARLCIFDIEEIVSNPQYQKRAQEECYIETHD